MYYIGYIEFDPPKKYRQSDFAVLPVYLHIIATTSVMCNIIIVYIVSLKKSLPLLTSTNKIHILYSCKVQTRKLFMNTDYHTYRNTGGNGSWWAWYWYAYMKIGVLRMET